MHPKMLARHEAGKPKAPIELLFIFRDYYDRLEAIPYGPLCEGRDPKYDELSKENIQEIRDDAGNRTVVDTTKMFAYRDGLFVSPETVACYYSHTEKEKLWKRYKRSEFKKFFFERYSIKGQGRNTIKREHLPEEFFKPFISWCIDNSYNIAQIAKVLEYAPPTIREWANGYGYKKWSVIRTNQPDLTGKHGRVEIESDTEQQGTTGKLVQGKFDWDRLGGQSHLNGVLGNDSSTHSLKLDKRVTDEKIIDTPSDEGSGVEDSPPVKEKKLNNDSGDMTVCFPGGLPKSVIKVLQDRINWRSVALRLQDPNVLYKIRVTEPASMIYFFKQAFTDTISGYVVLELVNIVRFKDSATDQKS